MSEFIHNDRDRQERLKEVIRELHQGRPVTEVKKKFAELIRNVGAEELASLEQALIAEGLPVEDVQRLCEVHVEVFRSALKREGRQDRLAGHPVHSYQLENKEARRRLGRLARLSWRCRIPMLGRPSVGDFQQAVQDLRPLLIHYTRKENQLFPFLELRGFTGPSKVMWGKHDEVRAAFRAIDAAIAADDLTKTADAAFRLVGKAKTLIFMEEHILFPTALRKLSDADWVAIRRGEADIGYAWVRPGNVWDADMVAGMGPSSGPRASESVADRKTAESAAGTVALDEGGLTPLQLRLLLKNLPMDITFVDEEDRVRFYSNGKERVFPRSPGIIGRTVQNCHPPKSVDVVDRILEAFKKKERDRAEFWIEKRGRFIHIGYYPVYDEAGSYRGVIEASQDATGLRGLQGERRLLDWT